MRKIIILIILSCIFKLTSKEIINVPIDINNLNNSSILVNDYPNYFKSKKNNHHFKLKKIYKDSLKIYQNFNHNIKIDDEIKDLIDNLYFIKQLSEEILFDEKLNKKSLISIKNLDIESESNFIDNYQTDIVLDNTKRIISINQVEASKEVTLSSNITFFENRNLNKGTISFELRDFLLYNFINNDHTIFDRDVKISGKFDIEFWNNDFSLALLKGSDIKLTNIDLLNIPIIFQLMKQLDVNIDRNMITAEIKIDKMGIGNGEFDVQGLNIVSDEFDIENCEFYWNNINEIDGSGIFNFHKYQEINRKKDENLYIKFVKSILLTEKISVSFTGNILFPILQINNPEVVYKYFIDLLETKFNKRNNKNLSKFRESYDKYLNSNNPEIAISTLASIAYLDKKKVLNDSLKNTIEKFKEKFINDRYYAIIDNIESIMKVDNSNKKHTNYDEIIAIINQNKLKNNEEEEITKNIINNLLTNDNFAVINKSLQENNTEALGLAFISLPIIDKKTQQIVYKHTLKLITERNKEILKVVGNYSIRQGANLAVGGQIVHNAQPLLENIFHGSHATGHKKLSKFLFGQNFQHIHQAIDMGGGWGHRFINHDPSIIFRMGKNYGIKGAGVTTQHLFQDFFTKDGIRILSPNVATSLFPKNPVKWSKFFSISSVRLMNGGRIAFFGYDTFKTQKKIRTVWNNYKLTGIKKTGIDFISNNGVQTINNKTAQKISKRLAKRGINIGTKKIISSTALSAMKCFNVVLYAWFFYDIFDASKEFYNYQMYQKPLNANISINMLFNNFDNAFRNSKELYVLNKKNENYLINYLSIAQLITPEQLSLFPNESTFSNQQNFENLSNEFVQVIAVCDSIIHETNSFKKKLDLYDQKLNLLCSFYNFSLASVHFTKNSLLSSDYILNSIIKYEELLAKYSSDIISDKKFFRKNQIKMSKELIYNKIRFLHNLSEIKKTFLNIDKNEFDKYKTSSYLINNLIDSNLSYYKDEKRDDFYYLLLDYKIQFNKNFK